MVQVYTAPAPTINFEALAQLNIAINGQCQLWQAQESSGVSVATGANYVADMWRTGITGSVVATVTIASATPPSGFNTYLHLAVTTGSSPGATDYCLLQQVIEGLRFVRLAFGGASAQPVTVCFWARAHRTGQYTVQLTNDVFSRVYCVPFTVSVADTWEFKTVVIPGDVTGTWLTGAVKAATVSIVLQSGSSNLASPNAWQGSALIGATGQVNGCAANTDTFDVTGLSIVPGAWPVPTLGSPRLMRSVSEEIALCQRYYEKSYDFGVPLGTASAQSGQFSTLHNALGTADYLQARIPFLVPKRITGCTMQNWDSAGNLGKISTAQPAAIGTNNVTGGPPIGAIRNALFTQLMSSGDTGVTLHWSADARL